MGLFDNLLGRGAQQTLDPQKAIMAVIVAAVKADGDIEEREILQIRSICAWSPVYSKNSSDEDSAVIQFAADLLTNDGPDVALQRAAGALSPALRETAFAFAVRIAFSDGFLGSAEQAFLEKLVASLEISVQRARQIIEVVSIMNHDRTA